MQCFPHVFKKTVAEGQTRLVFLKSGVRVCPQPHKECLVKLKRACLALECCPESRKGLHFSPPSIFLCQKWSDCFWHNLCRWRSKNWERTPTPAHNFDDKKSCVSPSVCACTHACMQESFLSLWQHFKPKWALFYFLISIPVS